MVAPGAYIGLVLEDRVKSYKYSPTVSCNPSNPPVRIPPVSLLWTTSLLLLLITALECARLALSFPPPGRCMSLTVDCQLPATTPPVPSSRMHSKRYRSAFSLMPFLQGHCSSPPASVYGRNELQGRLRQVRFISMGLLNGVSVCET